MGGSQPPGKHFIFRISSPLSAKKEEKLGIKQLREVGVLKQRDTMKSKNGSSGQCAQTNLGRACRLSFEIELNLPAERLLGQRKEAGSEYAHWENTSFNEKK